jgi:hypothetical protein
MLGLVLCSGCGGAHSFAVVPQQPDYALRAPDRIETPFPDTLKKYNGFEPGKNWLELRPRMQLRVENAYYGEGLPKHGLAGYLGTEVAQYQVEKDGSLKRLSVQSMVHRPRDQVAVQDLISEQQSEYKFHRFYYQILFKRASSARGSVLLGAESPQLLEQLAGELERAPETVCGEKSAPCTIFPEECSVALEMEIIVNGKPKTVGWASQLQSVIGNAHQVEVQRFYDGRLLPVKLDSADEQALRLPLLPGDRISSK